MTDTDTAELVARLRAIGNRTPSQEIDDATTEAADRLTALEAEAERLRAALKPFAFYGMKLAREFYLTPWITPAAIERARAALQPQVGK